MQGLIVLRALLQHVPGRLRALPDSRVAVRPAPSKWSGKEELGHLLDSAANNHQRIVRAQLENHPARPGYEQQRWVALHNYQNREWIELIDLWQALNRQLLVAAEAVSGSTWERTLTIAGSAPLTLKFVFEDYIEHMMHHLGHIGIEIDDLKQSAIAA
jgi:hypothetical protein